MRGNLDHTGAVVAGADPALYGTAGDARKMHRAATPSIASRVECSDTSRAPYTSSNCVALKIVRKKDIITLPALKVIDDMMRYELNALSYIQLSSALW